MTIKSSGNIQKMIRDYNKVDNLVIDVGIVEAEIKRRNGRNVQLATVIKTQEEGNRKLKVPSRKTLRPGVEEAKYEPRVKNLTGNIAAGNGYRIGLEKIGEVAVLKVKSNMQGLKDPALKPATIANRENPGTTNPLVDSGQLKRAIGAKINPR